MRSLAPLFSLLLVSSLSAYEIKPVALAPATMAELARVAVAPQTGQRHERPRLVPMKAAAEMVTRAALIVAPEAVAPPAVTRGFQAVTDPLPGASQGFDPADASGAVSAQYVVGVFNNAVTVHDRSGNLLSQVSAAQFWHDTTQPDKFLYDPRVAYDAASDRWVIIILGDEGATQTNGVLMIGFSTSGNPADGWRRFRIPVDQSGHLDGDISHLGITTDRIAITVRVFSDAQVNTTVFVSPKAAALAGPNLPITGNVFQPFDDLLPISSDDATLRLAAWEGDTSLTIFELSPNGGITNMKGYSVNVSFGPAARCAQLGTTFVTQCGDGVPLSGLTRDGTTWVVVDTFLSQPLVWKIKNGSATVYVIQDSTRALVFPSIAVNRRGAALVGYTAMGSAIYPTAAYSYIDPSGAISSVAVLKNGEAPFRRERWGDFTTTVVDPVNDLSFWTLGIYANTPINTITPYDRWATWWGFIQISDAPAHRRPIKH